VSSADAWQPGFFDPDPVSMLTESSMTVRSPAADASMRARRRALVLTDPVARLVRNAAHSSVDDSVYDLRQLALAGIDLAVASMGFARQITLVELVESIAELAARMRCGEPDRQADVDAARWVIKGLLNDAEHQGAFVYVFSDLRDGGIHREEYAFKLLQLQDSPGGAIVQASPQAVMLYLNGAGADNLIRPDGRRLDAMADLVPVDVAGAGQIAEPWLREDGSSCCYDSRTWV
jgi:hypothetical protein